MVLMGAPALGLFAVLKDVVVSDTGVAREMALDTLSDLASNNDNMVLMGAPALGLFAVLKDVVVSDTGVARENALGTLWNLICRNYEIVDGLMSCGIFKIILSQLQASEDYPSSIKADSAEHSILFAVFEMSALENSRTQLRNDGALDVVLPIMDCNDIHGLISSMIFAFLAGKDESGPYAERFMSGSNLIERLVVLLETTINGVDGDGYELINFDLIAVLRNISEMCLSDKNKSQLANARVRDLLVRVVNDVKDDKTTKECAAEACRALSILSFINQSDKELRAENGFIPDSTGIRELLKAYVGKIPQEANSDVMTLLGRLYRSELSSYSPDDYKHTMVSYCWHESAKPQLVKEVCIGLREIGFEIWRDEDGSAYVDKMSTGALDDRMAEAIERSYAVVIFVSEKYKDRPNCRLEATYAGLRLKQSEFAVRCLSHYLYLLGV
jgi:hypothetical protein